MNESASVRAEATGGESLRPRRLRPGALGGLVLFAGIGSVATEMCASRLLASYYGSGQARGEEMLPTAP